MKHLSIIRNFPIFEPLAFYSLLGSGVYIILLWSPHILGQHLGFWARISIYLFPWLMLWLAYSWQVITAREHRLKIILMVGIIILGVANTILSGPAAKSSHNTMRTFLLTGIFALWASLFLVNNPRRRQLFDWFCAAALGVIILVEMSVFMVQGKYASGVFQVFVLHLIPLGTLIILLSSGPVRLMVSKSSTARLLGWLLALLGCSLIYLTHKRGTLLVVAAMVAIWMLYLVRRRKYLFISLLLAFTLIVSLQAQRRFARLDANIARDVAILHRLELYPFALHIWKTHPFMGIGLRSFTHEQYLPDYQLHNQDLREFPPTVAKLQTLDNMLLTALVELGTVMTLFYLGLILYILVRYCRRLRSWPQSSPLDWYRVLILLGFAIHSLTYDSLLFPPVNWLFHVQLGIMAGYQASETAPG